MNLLKKHWRLLAVLVFGAFYLAFWLVAKDIIESGVELKSDGRETKDTEDIVDVDVSLVINNQTFSEKMTSNESVKDLLERLRNDGKLTYEILEYTYGTELISVNGQIAPEGYKWNIYEDSLRIANFTDYKLSDNKTYMVRLDAVVR